MSYHDTGWVKFAPDPRMTAWIEAAKPAAIRVAQDPDMQRDWLRCGGTWFVGVNALPNLTDGSVSGVPLAGQAVDFVHEYIKPEPILWDSAQVSVCYEGYPQPWEGESDAALAFRRNRDAAHVDGLHGEGQPRRRFLREFHQFLLGIALTDSPAKAAPFVIWEGSHKIVQRAFSEALAPYPVAQWPEVDLTDVNMATRREIFETCPRVELPLKTGEAYVIHRHALHGVAPWEMGLKGPIEGRMIAYFRPADESKMQQWVDAD
ncbi:hypothetical protein [Amylibacter sp. IMCC11727]|uniref:hypothetical protein n=1 Tax=Amylibacter sp. IMCC11727 TaxID=3039851 RepID=UPI00244DF5A1|nr:hypothetical protein [Amylibacter sp. IMCC11727]WGI21043.1 hypothetical protein QBD29_13125 [Amylibacter sp. IMCC11727]